MIFLRVEILNKLVFELCLDFIISFVAFIPKSKSKLQNLLILAYF